MNISTKTRYGFRFMVYLAMNDTGKNIQLSEIAEKEDISMKYLEKIVQILKRASLVHVTRGSKGGYRLAKNQEEISLKDIYIALEGTASVLDCVDTGNCERKEKCSTFGLWDGLSKVISDYFGSQSLKDLAESQRKDDYMYFI